MNALASEVPASENGLVADPAAIGDVSVQVLNLARAGRLSQRALAMMSSGARASALLLGAAALRRAVPVILEANARDVEDGAAAGLSGAMLDRLRLDPARIDAMATAVEEVAALGDPVGQIIDETNRPNGMVLRRVRVPIGLIGIIYESRPNVTADAAALCVRSGNAALLRGDIQLRESAKPRATTNP